ncbi:MAG: efflux RND transporter periplasmic adaptor subunit [Paludibacteraceae bacterium]|nr:efflux RND transporter periplasmic adaptor subunit [Paludibacteraceae bacterium]
MKKKIIIIAVLVVAAIVAAIILWPSKKEVVFSTFVVDTATVENTITATGNIEPVDKVEVGTQVSGIVEKVYVDYNSHVKKGQLLAELDKQTLKERLRQCESQVTSSQSQLKHAQQNYNRTKELYEAKATTKVEMEDAEHTLVQAQSSYNNAQTSLREAKVNLGYAEIYSPIDGVILSKDIEEGQTVASSFNTPTLFVIARDLKKMQVEANIDEADIGQVKKGQKCTFTVDAYNGEEFSGVVEQIRLQPTTTNNVVKYTVILYASNPEEKLYPGMTASISIITRQETGNVAKMEALNFNPDKTILEAFKPSKERVPHEGNKDPMPNREGNEEPDFSQRKKVWIKNGNSIRPCPIEIGLDDGVNAIITGGDVQKGDTLILSASFEQKKAKKEAGANLFGPPRRDSKNRGGNRPPM